MTVPSQSPLGRRVVFQKGYSALHSCGKKGKYMRGTNLISLGWRGNHLKYCKLQHILQQPYLWQSIVKSPSVWTWRPWGPGSSPSMVPSIKQRPSDSCRKRTTPWILPRPASMATADPRSVTKLLFLRLSLWFCA